jgi:hypothetical protein
MGAILMYELMAEERVAQYRAEAVRDRQLAQIAAGRRRAAVVETEAPRTPVRPSLNAVPAVAAHNAAGTRRALAAAFVGFVTLGALRRRRVTGR